MKNISDFLSRYLGLKPAGHALEEALKKVIYDVLGAEMPKGSIVVRGGAAYIDAPAVLKSEIALRKADILGALTNTSGGSLREIR